MKKRSREQPSRLDTRIYNDTSYQNTFLSRIMSRQLGTLKSNKVSAPDYS